MALFNESGAENDSRVAEARQLLKIIEDGSAELSSWEEGFIASISEQLDYDMPTISTRQIFKLRDIKDRAIR